ncbi:hypothetical protein Vafri_10645 [Volvox africanus]|uniref:Uncharacterized protein n=1 Tax=Volvox africanus TaxID=51714 RepID=A0A8J4EZT3_9CHLO|nr:hypothetical protein Vafri_10645 [Volvox africanus]
MAVTFVCIPPFQQQPSRLCCCIQRRAAALQPTRQRRLCLRQQRRRQHVPGGPSLLSVPPAHPESQAAPGGGTLARHQCAHLHQRPKQQGTVLQRGSRTAQGACSTVAEEPAGEGAFR